MRNSGGHPGKLRGKDLGDLSPKLKVAEKNFQEDFQSWIPLRRTYRNPTSRRHHQHRRAVAVVAAATGVAKAVAAGAMAAIVAAEVFAGVDFVAVAAVDCCCCHRCH